VVVTLSGRGFIKRIPAVTYRSQHRRGKGVKGMGIRVGSIAPGQVANELWGITDPDEIDRKSFDERQFLRSEDVARAVVFMLSQPPHVTIRNLVILPQGQDI
jgi:NADP-dependent 3-hydroxy acid dehydrogenase YdfG